MALTPDELQRIEMALLADVGAEPDALEAAAATWLEQDQAAQRKQNRRAAAAARRKKIGKLVRNNPKLKKECEEERKRLLDELLNGNTDIQ